MKKIIIALSVLTLAACNPTTTVQTVKAVKDIGCVVVTAETRAEIRSKQNVQTNICMDEIE